MKVAVVMGMRGCIEQCAKCRKIGHDAKTYQIHTEDLYSHIQIASSFFYLFIIFRSKMFEWQEKVRILLLDHITT